LPVPDPERRGPDVRSAVTGTDRAVVARTN
jgi:hypothetical protein